MAQSIGTTHRKVVAIVTSALVVTATVNHLHGTAIADLPHRDVESHRHMVKALEYLRLTVPYDVLTPLKRST